MNCVLYARRCFAYINKASFINNVSTKEERGLPNANAAVDFSLEKANICGQMGEGCQKRSNFADALGSLWMAPNNICDQ